MPFYFENPLLLLCWLLIPTIWISLVKFPPANRSKRQRFISGIFRSATVFVIGLALADVRIEQGADQINLLYCLDLSDSITYEEQQATREFIERATSEMKSRDQAGLIVFGKRPYLEQSLSKDFSLKKTRSQVNANFTDINAALQAAVGKFPTKGDNRIVLLSDGNQNLHEAREAANLAASLGVEIYPVALGNWFSRQEVFVESLVSPSTIQLETPFDIQLVITSTLNGKGEVLLFRNGRLIAEEKADFQKGKNVYRFVDVLNTQGLYLYKAIVHAPQDKLYQNNEGLSFTKGTKPTELLYLSSQRQENLEIVRILKEQGFDVVSMKPQNLSDSLSTLLDYRAVLLDNVSGQNISPRVKANLEKFVKDIGGGLIMIGGNQSFGAGYFQKTPIEKALPVYLDIPTTLDKPSLSLVLVIDKSSSMAEHINTKSKLEGAKIAAFSVVELLNPIDKVGLVAFDTEYRWIVPITQARNRQLIAGQLVTLEEEGGTNLYPALKEAYRELSNINTVKKHVIILSDGITDKADFQPLLKSIRSANITVSTVAVGNDSNIQLMDSIAEWGSGRSYFTNDAENIPKIFIDEAQIVTRSVVTENNLKPHVQVDSEILTGIPTESIPSVQGIDITFPKPGASVILNTAEGPLLSAWRYGLGRSVAFTSDFSGRWSKDWMRWDSFGRIVANMVKWVQRKETDVNFSVHVDKLGDQGRYSVDVLDKDRQFVNQLSLELKVISPKKSDTVIQLDQTEPGRYSGDFQAEETGEYYFSLYRQSQEGSVPVHRSGFAVPYSDEFSHQSNNAALLEDLARITRGKMLSLDSPQTGVFAPDPDKRQPGYPLWPYLILLSIFLLILDVAARKIQSLRPAGEL